MKYELVAELRQRNARIIEAIIKKADRVCPGSIAGSFCPGDIHERSDLDLCIVINDDDGWKIADCFILNELGFDIYCTPWHRLEAMAEHMNPHQDQLDAPYSMADANHVPRHFTDAMNAYASVMLSDTAAECNSASARMLLAIEYVIYLANKSYIHRGIRRIPEELRAMKKLPQEFWIDYQQLPSAVSYP